MEVALTEERVKTFIQNAYVTDLGQENIVRVSACFELLKTQPMVKRIDSHRMLFDVFWLATEHEYSTTVFFPKRCPRYIFICSCVTAV